MSKPKILKCFDADGNPLWVAASAVIRVYYSDSHSDIVNIDYAGADGVADTVSADLLAASNALEFID